MVDAVKATGDDIRRGMLGYLVARLGLLCWGGSIERRYVHTDNMHNGALAANAGPGEQEARAPTRLLGFRKRPASVRHAAPCGPSLRQPETGSPARLHQADWGASPRWRRPAPSRRRPPAPRESTPAGGRAGPAVQGGPGAAFWGPGRALWGPFRPARVTCRWGVRCRRPPTLLLAAAAAAADPRSWMQLRGVRGSEGALRAGAHMWAAWAQLAVGKCPRRGSLRAPAAAEPVQKK
eukprot:scaffold604_cov384-Prasinococcus_capsulatus_cf.AAC.16